MLRALQRASSLWLFLVLQAVRAALPSEIVNEASVQYVPSGTDEVFTLYSETVRAEIEYRPNFILMDEQRRQVVRGESVLLSHRLMNQGPQALTFQLLARNRAVSSFEPSTLHIFHDVNRNGEIDSEDIELTDAHTIPLGADEEIGLLVRAAIPANARANQSASIAVMAREVSTDMQQMRIDTLDVMQPDSVLGFFIEKTVSRVEAEIGETVDYVVRVKNVTNHDIPDVQFVGALPVGFVYVPGSFRIGTDRVSDPALAGGSLTRNLGDLAAGATLTLKYTARIDGNALHGDGTSRAQANSPGFMSNFATTIVRIRPGVFTPRGVIVGRVFADTNGNGLLDPDEKGVPGVRVFIEDGTSALTDTDGKYSFYGLSSRTHIVKVDVTTLPHDTSLAITSNDQAGDAGSQFASLKHYELHKTNFALRAISPDALAEIEARRAALRGPTGEIVRELSGRLTADGLPTPIADPKALPSSGVVSSGDSDPFFTVAATRPATKPTAAAAEKTAAADNFDALANVTNNEFGFVMLRDRAVLPTAQTDVWIKGPLGSRFTLAANGAVIGEDQIGTKATVPDRGVEAWSFVGVNLTPGENRLRATLVDPFGNERGSATVRVIAPGTLAYIKVTPPDQAIADGSTVSFVHVELLDARGTPVTARTPLTLETTRGQWRVEDLDPATQGTQVFVEGGHASFPLVPPLDPGESDLRFNSGAVRTESSVMFAPNLRPMVAAGVVEGTLNFGSRRGSIFPVGARDAFEEELRLLSATSSDGRLGGSARVAFFLKGKVRGDYLLTAAYDSDKAERDRLFRDIQPGEFYPVYGDASERSYDAQSTGRLYVRLDRQRSYLLVGDFTTAAAVAGGDSAQSLGNYQRSFTGAKEHYETDRVTANVWASQDSTRQVVSEVAANGTSGPYEFSVGEITANSERVEILVRDRNQPARVIEVRPLVRFLDYEFEPFTGHLLLRAPAPSVDADLNPMSIRLTAEVDQGGEKFWAYGGDAHVKVSPRVEIGGGYARDENPRESGELQSVDGTWKVSTRTKLLAELARTYSYTAGEGLAGRVDLKHEGERAQVHAYIGKTDVAFHNAGALLLPGRVEGGLRFNYKLSPTTTLLTQGLITESLATGNRLQGVRADIERAFGAWRIAVGGRHSEETSNRPGGLNSTVDSLRAKVTAPVPHLASASVFAEYERDIRDSRELAATGFDYSLRQGGRAYARHEFITSLGGPFELDQTQRKHTTVFGLERAYMKDGRMFNEYRADNEILGREAEAATGLRNLWKIADGIRANTSFERITPISGTGRNASTSVTGALDYAVDPLWRANARLELRTSTSTDSMLNTLGYARLLDRDWTLLGKTIVLVTHTKGASAGEMLQSRAQAGLAWRPARFDRWNALAKYELKHETDSRATASFSRRSTHMVSGDVNYQPSQDWTISGHYAGKLVEEALSSGGDRTVAHLVGARAGYTLTRRLDVGANASVLSGGGIQQGRYAVGPEVGVLVGRNLNLGVGYNVVGFRDRDFAPDGSTAHGAYIRLRFKFDENLFSGRGGRSS